MVALTWLIELSNSLPTFTAAVAIAPTAAAAAAVAAVKVFVIVPIPLPTLLKALLKEASTFPAILIAISISLLLAISLRHLLCYFYKLKNRQVLNVLEACL
jgi:hypothetical protein